MRTNLTADTYRRLDTAKTCVSVKKLCLFGLFGEDKGNYIDEWVIKIAIKQIKLIWMFASFRADNIQKPCLSQITGFFPLAYSKGNGRM